MQNFVFYTNPTWTLAYSQSRAPAMLSLETIAELSGVHGDMIRYYSRLGLVRPVAVSDRAGLYFDLEALSEIRRLEHYRQSLGVKRRALVLISALRRESERQNIEISFLRDPA